MRQKHVAANASHKWACHTFVGPYVSRRSFLFSDDTLTDGEGMKCLGCLSVYA